VEYFDILWAAVQQDLDGVVKRLAPLALLLHLLEPQDGVHALPHDAKVLGEALDGVRRGVLLVQPVHLLLLRVLEVGAPGARLPHLPKERARLRHPVVPRIHVRLGLEVVALQVPHQLFLRVHGAHGSQLIGQGIGRWGDRPADGGRGPIEVVLGEAGGPGGGPVAPRCPLERRRT
jgi:hypothetical protein